MKTNWPDHRIHSELAARNPARLEDVQGKETTPHAREVLSQVLSGSYTGKVRTSPSKGRRTLLALAAAAALAVAVSFGATATRGGGTTHTTTAQRSTGQPNGIQLVSFSRSGGDIVARITDPLAAASQLDAAFHSHGINISVQILPASPSLVGSIVFMSSPSNVDIRPIQAGNCLAGGTQCTVGLVIPAGFHGPADVTVGRAARPGERYASADNSFGPGEALHCSGVLNSPVSDATAVLKAKGLTPEWRLEGVSPSYDVAVPPLDDYVVDGTPISSTTVMLWVAAHPYPNGSQFLRDAQAGC